MKLAIGLNEDGPALMIADQSGQAIDLSCSHVKSEMFAGRVAIVGEDCHRVDVYGSFDVLEAKGEIYRITMRYPSLSRKRTNPDPNESLLATTARKLGLPIYKFSGGLLRVRLLNAVTVARLFGHNLDELATILRAFDLPLMVTGDKRYYVEPEAIEALAIAERLGANLSESKEAESALEKTA